MANLPISGLPAAPEALLTDELATNQSGITKKITGQQIIAMIDDQLRGPILRDVGDFFIQTVDPNIPFLDVGPGNVGYYRLVNTTNEVYDALILPPGIDQTQPLVCSIIFQPISVSAGQVDFNISYTKTQIGNVPGPVTQEVISATTNEVARQFLETSTFDISTPISGESLNIRVNFDDGTSTYPSNVGLNYLKIVPTYV